MVFDDFGKCSNNTIAQQHIKTAVRIPVFNLLPFNPAFALPEQWQNQLIVAIEKFDETFDRHLKILSYVSSL